MNYREEDISVRSISNRLNKIYSAGDLTQLSFDFTSTYNDNLYNYYSNITKECRSIYKKQDGSLVVRVTKHRPIKDSEHWCSPGHINGYGHKMVDYYEQYKFKL